MDQKHYFNIYTYLVSKTLPEDFSPQQQQQLMKQANNYILKDDVIFKRDKKIQNKLYRVIKKDEVATVLHMMHNDPTSGHLGIEATFNKIRSRYYWPQFYEEIKRYVETCDACQRRGRPRRNNELYPIPVHSPFYQIGIDIVGPLPRTQRGKKYIVTAMDYLTKWPEARALTEATAEKVADFIYEQIICQHGCPQIILTDRGTHFNNNMVDRLLSKFKIKHLLSTPYHPQTNGLVERFNRTICESLAKLSDKTNDWDLFIPPVLFAYRTTKHSTTKIEPFFLVYGRSARLPLDDLEKDDHMVEDDRLHQLIEDVPQIRKKAQREVIQSQNKQKEKHGPTSRGPITFLIGEKVLYFKMAQDQSHSGKLNPKWKGPFYIHNVLPNGAYKLRTIEGQILAAPVNGNLLKYYKEE
jgi:Integrase zinc binding domain/Integrase core domain